MLPTKFRQTTEDRRQAPSDGNKMTNNDIQNITHKTKDRVTQTPLKIKGELRCYGRVSSSCSSSGTCRFTLISNPMNEERTGKCLRQVEHIRDHL